MFRNGSRSQNLERPKKVALAPNSIKTKEEETMVIKSSEEEVLKSKVLWQQRHLVPNKV